MPLHVVHGDSWHGLKLASVFSWRKRIRKTSLTKKSCPVAIIFPVTSLPVNTTTASQHTAKLCFHIHNCQNVPCHIGPCFTFCCVWPFRSSVVFIVVVLILPHIYCWQSVLVILVPVLLFAVYRLIVLCAYRLRPTCNMCPVKIYPFVCLSVCLYLSAVNWHLV